ncbi:tetratricopeptide repeat protein [Undibacterium sp. Ji49W]|uniref:tetratricopeptide repeat protein n=1 Tax=Undibacterium sp. Ji49W TaxID=3413040 RepID=UPI003BF03E32
MLNWLKNIFSPPAAIEKEIPKPVGHTDPAPVAPTETAASFKSRGDTHLDQGDWARAAAQYKKALELNPDFAEVHNNLGLALMRQGENDQAKHHLQQAVSIKPDMFNTYYVLGMLAQQLGQFVEATDHFAKVITIRPDFKEGYIAHAGALSDARLFDAALASYERAIVLDPADPSANWGKSLVQLAMGDYEHGWRQYEWRWKDFAKGVARHYPPATLVGRSIHQRQDSADLSRTGLWRCLSVLPLHSHAGYAWGTSGTGNTQRNHGPAVYIEG